MWRIVLVIWTVASSVLAGVFILVVLATPELSNSQDVVKYIEIAAAAGAIIAIPASYVIARSISKASAVKKT